MSTILYTAPDGHQLVLTDAGNLDTVGPLLPHGGFWSPNPNSIAHACIMGLAAERDALRADVASLTEENVKFRALGCNGAKVDNFDAAMAENAKLRADRDRLQRERGALAEWCSDRDRLVERLQRERDALAELGSLVLEVLLGERTNSVDVGSRWYGMKIDVLREKEARGDGINVYSIGGNYPKTDTAPLIEALRAAIQAAPTGGAAPQDREEG